MNHDPQRDEAVRGCNVAWKVMECGRRAERREGGGGVAGRVARIHGKEARNGWKRAWAKAAWRPRSRLPAAVQGVAHVSFQQRCSL